MDGPDHALAQFFAQVMNMDLNRIALYLFAPAVQRLFESFAADDLTGMFDQRQQDREFTAGQHDR